MHVGNAYQHLASDLVSCHSMSRHCVPVAVYAGAQTLHETAEMPAPTPTYKPTREQTQGQSSQQNDCFLPTGFTGRLPQRPVPTALLDESCRLKAHTHTRTHTHAQTQPQDTLLCPAVASHACARECPGIASWCGVPALHPRSMHHTRTIFTRSCWNATPAAPDTQIRTSRKQARGHCPPKAAQTCILSPTPQRTGFSGDMPGPVFPALPTRLHHER